MDPKETLIKNKVNLINPETIEIGKEVDPDRISGEGVVIHSGSKIYGADTLILPNARIGYEGPATVENCFVGPGVTLAGGYFKNSVFLKNTKMGYGAHIREGCIIEEGASVAHTVGLKQTILFPFVTLGSLINFCDCLMAGGTSRKNHSEVGSSYIHFNYTPNQDKATPSLLGDVPRGVMLDQPPIFLGGQGGLVGPCQIAFGTVIAAGSIYRKDVMSPGKLVMPGPLKAVNTPHTLGHYRSIKRIVGHNVHYIASLMALSQWYANVRALFVSKACPDTLLQGSIAVLNLNIRERIKRLGLFSSKLPESVELYRNLLQGGKSHPAMEQQLEFNQKWPEIEKLLIDFDYTDNSALSDPFLNRITDGIREKGNDYIEVIRHTDKSTRAMGTLWLDKIISDINKMVFSRLPTLK